MVIGGGLFSFLWHQNIACWIFLVGAIMFSSIQCLQTYDGKSITIKRLKRIMTLADILFILAGILMVDNSSYSFLLPLFSLTDTSTTSTGYINYMTYVKNKWVILLLIAAVLEVYTIHRIAHELEKEEETSKKA